MYNIGIPISTATLNATMHHLRKNITESIHMNGLLAGLNKDFACIQCDERPNILQTLYVCKESLFSVLFRRQIHSKHEIKESLFKKLH